MHARAGTEVTKRPRRRSPAEFIFVDQWSHCSVQALIAGGSNPRSATHENQGPVTRFGRCRSRHLRRIGADAVAIDIWNRHNLRRDALQGRSFRTSEAEKRGGDLKPGIVGFRQRRYEPRRHDHGCGGHVTLGRRAVSFRFDSRGESAELLRIGAREPASPEKRRIFRNANSRCGRNAA
jgi:hypothetical protein